MGANTLCRPQVTVNNQDKQDSAPPSLTTIKARTRRLLIDTAMSMYEQGAFPSITEVANAAQLSRATAYRYFPTQSALVSAMVDESLGPILAWQPTQPDAGQRIAELLSFAYPRMLQHEGVLRAALHLSLQQWADNRSNPNNKEKLVRGNRKRLLKLAVEPLEETGTRSSATGDPCVFANLWLRSVYGAEGYLASE